MSTSGIGKKSFENSIYGLSLCFKDQEIEEAFMLAKTNLVMLTTGAKRFLIVIIIGYIVVYGLDAATALVSSVNYTFSCFEWILYSLFIPVIILEVTFYFFPNVSLFRGAPWTLMGALIAIERIYFYEPKGFYPNFGTE